MSIVIDMNKEDFDTVLRNVAELEDLTERAEQLSALSMYEEKDLSEYETMREDLEKVIAERDDIKRKYVERFFTPETKEVEVKETEDEEEKTEITFNDLLKEVY